MVTQDGEGEIVKSGSITWVDNLKVLKRLQINLIKVPVNILYLLCKLASLVGGSSSSSAASQSVTREGTIELFQQI